MKRFIPGLGLILTLLIGVIYCAFANQIFFAKLFGFVLTIFTTVALRIWLKNARKFKIKPDTIRFTINDKYVLNRCTPIYSNLKRSEKKIFENKLGAVLSQVSFYTDNDKSLDSADCIHFGVLFLLVNGFDLPNVLDKLVVVYSGDNEIKIEKQGVNKVLFVSNEAVLGELKQYATLEEAYQNKQSLVFNLL